MSAVYDGIFETKKYELEVQQILGLIKKRNSGLSVIDIGCGTGNHAKFFNKKVKYEGIDVNAQMIKKARQKKLNVSFYAESLDSFSSKNSSNYNVAVSLFSVINHLMDTESLITFFKNVNKVLKKDSHFIFDCWNGYAAIRDHPKKEVRNYSGDILTLTPTVDPFKQTVDIEYSLIASKGFDKLWEDNLTMTLWTPKTIYDCLNIAGFTVASVSSGFGKQKLLDFAKPEDYKLLFHCRK